MRILGIDPGLATGLAIYDTDTCKVIHAEQTEKGVIGFKPTFKRIWGGAFGNEYKTVRLVGENFTLRSSNKFTADLHGVEIIGWMKGESFWNYDCPEPSQHMQLTRLRKNVDDYSKSPITHMMKEAGFKIGKGHTRMALSVAVWYAAMRLKHIPTLEMLKAKGD